MPNFDILRDLFLAQNLRCTDLEVKGVLSRAFWFRLLITIFAVVAPFLATAEAGYDPDNPSRPQPIEMVRDLGGTLISADYDAIEEAYPQLLELRDQLELDSWLDTKMSYMRKGQVAQLVVNTKIQVDTNVGNLVSAFQYKDGRRVSNLIFTGKKQGQDEVVEIKGSGSDDPVQGLNSNGLLSFAVGEKELILEKIISRIVRYAHLDIKTVPHLAVSATGFEIIRADGGKELAGKLMRAPRKRKLTKRDAVHPDKAKALEHVFRLFGLTSTLELEKSDIVAINIQGDIDESLLDFGHYQIRDKFRNDKFLIVGGLEGIPERDGNYILDAPEDLKIPVESAFRFDAGTFVGQEDKLIAAIKFIMRRHWYKTGYDLAAMRDDLNQFTENLLTQFDEKLRKVSFEEWASRHADDPKISQSLATIGRYLKPAQENEGEKIKIWRRPKIPVAGATSRPFQKFVTKVKRLALCKWWLANER